MRHEKPFTVGINCSSDLKNFANSWLSASNFKFFSLLVEQFFLTVGQNNFGTKIPFLLMIFGEIEAKKIASEIFRPLRDYCPNS